MLCRRLVFLYLFILFTGSFAQKYNRNDVEADDEEEISANSRNQPLIDSRKSQNRISSGNIDNNDRNPQETADQLPPQRSVNSGRISQQDVDQPRPLDSARRSSPTPLASSDECRPDVERYCSKGTKKMISNLKVLQCVDELDNVSFFLFFKMNSI